MMYPYPSYFEPHPSYDGGVEKHIKKNMPPTPASTVAAMVGGSGEKTYFFSKLTEKPQITKYPVLCSELLWSFKNVVLNIFMNMLCLGRGIGTFLTLVCTQ